MTVIRWCWVAALGLTLVTTACGSSDTDGAGERAVPIQRTPTPENEFTPAELEGTIDSLVAEINKSAIEPAQMAVLLKQQTGFWAPVVTAANRAMGELGVAGNVLGPIAPSGDIEESEELQNQQIKQAVADGAEGIGIAPFGDAQAAALEEAMAKGVQVVTLDTDLSASKRSIYVGTLNKAAGATAAETLLAMLPQPPGTVMIHGNDNPGWVDGMDRTHGAREVFEKAGYGVLVRSATWDATGEAEDVEWMKDTLEAADPPVVGLLGLFNVSYRCAMAADAASKPDIPIVAFDFDPKTVDYMRKGRIKATHTQRQYYEGYLVPYILYGIKAIGLDATKDILAPQMVDDDRVNTGLDVVPGDKIDAYYDFLSSIGAN
ncbi:sugar ABC transporter substrate-binding protein [Sorangium sp. So ce1078]|uniref:sugar ABC transporter substrate-binding protein n=1 Tax=Sorangium sp. So ce1078 TaxID=3133329 RepID=UPI003F5D6063